MSATSIPFVKVLVDVVIFAAAILPTILINYMRKANVRSMDCSDSSIYLPLKSETVPDSILITGNCMGLVVIVMVECYRLFYVEVGEFGATARKGSHKLLGRTLPPLLCRLYTILGGYVFGLLLINSITDITKVSVGRLRPHFIAVCSPDRNICAFHPGDPRVKVVDTGNICEGSDSKRIFQARLSFPSGHASTSCFAAVFIGIYLWSRLPELPEKLLKGGLLRPLCIAVPTVLALLCSVSRVADHFHHWDDVLAGGILGIVGAIFTELLVVQLIRNQQRLLFNEVKLYHSNSKNLVVTEENGYTNGQCNNSELNEILSTQ